MKQTLAFLLKFAVTLGIFVAIFLEFGGGYAPVRTAELTAPGTFEAANPDYPGLVGRLRARLRAPCSPVVSSGYAAWRRATTSPRSAARRCAVLSLRCARSKRRLTTYHNRLRRSSGGGASSPMPSACSKAHGC